MPHPLRNLMTLAMTFSALALAACNSQDGSGANPGAAPPPPGPATPAEDPNQMIHAEGWDVIKLIGANSADTILSRAGHFDTSRNGCGYPDYGALETANWNIFVKPINKALAQPEAAEYCLETPDVWPRMDGDVEVTLEDGRKRQLFKSKGSWEVCTTIQDRAVAQELLNSLHQFVQLADKEGCPGGWGSR